MPLLTLLGGLYLSGFVVAMFGIRHDVWGFKRLLIAAWWPAWFLREL